LDSMKHYSTYQSQFIEMFGTGTPKYKVSDICEVKGGSTPSRTNTLFWDNGDVPWFTVEDIYTQGKYIRETKQHITKLATKKCFVYPKDTVVICCTASIGECALAKIEMASNQQFNGMIIKDRSKLDPQFLLYVSSTLKDDLLRQAGKTTIHFVSRTKLEEMLIPVPTMDKQQRFVTIMDQADKSKFTSLKSQFIEMFGNPLSSVQRYPLKKLGDCCELNPRRPNLTLKETDKVSFVPMPSVSENGYLQDVVDEEYGKVKKGFTYFENNDVLFAKITPCMENGKGAIAEGLINNIGMGSTEFHVLRPIEGVSSPYWLLALTRLPIFRERASKNMTGTGGQKRVPANYLENFMVGHPSIEEQNRFENIYKQADKSKFELRKSIEAIDAVIKSLING